MNDKNKKEGVSVKEIEGYVKSNRYEVFFVALFVLATLFTLVFWGAKISIFLAGIGAIVGTLLSAQVDQFSHKMGAAVFSKEATTQLLIGLVCLIVAIFLAPVIFLVLGLHAGKGMVKMAKKSSSGGPKAS